MAKQQWKSGNMVYPLPAVMVSCGNNDVSNIVTVAWTGTICTNPAMTYISLRPSRYSYDIIKENKSFVINLTTKKLLFATDFCGVRSGRDINKFEKMGLTSIYGDATGCPMIDESPVNIECTVDEIKQLGSHDMFIATVVNVYADDKYMDDNGKFHLNKTELVAYSHGGYFELGKQLGSFGYSVRKKKKTKNL
ncbi:MAG: flavin reductase [Epulopiscium sp. Nele67-Bin004]|nr:MAG: flavin reductase [Epulopiscium sp. Nele67-Bin004]